MSLFTKQEHSLIFSALKKSSFLKSMLLLNFLIRWSWNILNLFNISMMLNKWIIKWFWVDVTTKAQSVLSRSIKIKNKKVKSKTNRTKFIAKLFFENYFQKTLCHHDQVKKEDIFFGWFNIIHFIFLTQKSTCFHIPLT